MTLRTKLRIVVSILCVTTLFVFFHNCAPTDGFAVNDVGESSSPSAPSNNNNNQSNITRLGKYIDFDNQYVCTNGSYTHETSLYRDEKSKEYWAESYQFGCNTDDQTFPDEDSYPGTNLLLTSEPDGFISHYCFNGKLYVYKDLYLSFDDTTVDCSAAN